MCGIAGYVTTSGGEAGEATLAAMTGAIRHRGPDGEGFWRGDGAALGHRRLSIVDLAGGGQPMANEDESLWVVYNGEIFNHAELRPGLERAGHVFRTRCDTETILHAYEEHGPKSLDLYRGMFAFALWDRKSHTLFCARDRLGIKPFYYWWDGRVFAFASEIKALIEHPEIKAALNPAAVAEYLAFGYGSGAETLFRGIRKLMPGHWLRLDARTRRLEIERYWDVPREQARESYSEREWIAECRRRLEETVRMRLMSDVPLGAFLSGGVDSSAITAIAQKMTGAPVHTFSVGYAEKKYSELSYAATVARALGTSHHEVTLSRDEFFGHLPLLVHHEDEPVCWPSSVSLYFVSKLAAERVKVVLTGEGSDEIFAGYHRYGFYFLNEKALPYWRLLPPKLRTGIQAWTQSTALLPAGVRRKLEHTLLGRGDEFESLYLDNFYSAFPDSERRTLAGADSPYANYLSYWNAPGAPSHTLDRLLYADQKTYLVELLMKQDQMSMAASIESRVPLLDHTLVEFAARVPAALKLRGRDGKFLFKSAVADLLPREIVDRPKMGFPTPLRDWLSPSHPGSKALLDALEDREGFLAGVLDSQALGSIVSRHRAGQIDGTDRIWRLLNFQIWGDLFLTGRGAARWEPILGRTAPLPA